MRAPAVRVCSDSIAQDLRGRTTKRSPALSFRILFFNITIFFSSPPPYFFLSPFFRPFLSLSLFLRIRSAKILVIGATGISAELCKNIVLAGIHSLTLLDDQAITEVDLTGQFLLTVEQIGQNVR